MTCPNLELQWPEVKISSLSAAESSMKFSGFLQKNSTEERANFPHESLPVVVLGASPVEIFSSEKSSEFSGRETNVKVPLRGSGHVVCVLSETVCAWSNLVNALSVKVPRGNGNIGSAAARKWVFFHGSLRFGCGFCAFKRASIEFTGGHPKKIHLKSEQVLLNNFWWVPDSRHRKAEKSLRDLFENIHVNAVFLLGAPPKGRTATQRSKKGSEKGSGEGF